jgi:hypothetical protein
MISPKGDVSGKRCRGNAGKLEVSPSSSTADVPVGGVLSRTEKKIISQLKLSVNDPAFYVCWDDEAVEECILAFTGNQIANIPHTPAFMGPEETLSPRFISPLPTPVHTDDSYELSVL